MSVAMPTREKRAADPLDQQAKPRFHYGSYYTSGSEHGFLEPDELMPDVDNERNHDGNSRDSDDNDNRAAHQMETVQTLLNPFKKLDSPFRLRLYSEVIKASEAFAVLRSIGSGYRRAVMARLRQAGYNAGICKARWEGSGGVTAGNYECIDIVSGDKERYILDLDFVSQFEVARATTEYKKLTEMLPTVMICKAEELRQVVRVLAAAAKKSLKERELSVPPWRKSRYMIAKWLGPYRRTVNLLASSSGCKVAGDREVKCRTVGFMSAPRGAILFN